MKKKLTNFGVYIVKKVFSPVYDKIYGKGWDDARRMWDAAQDYPVVGPEEPDTYDSFTPHPDYSYTPIQESDQMIELSIIEDEPNEENHEEC